MIGFSSIADFNFGKTIDLCQRINKPRFTLWELSCTPRLIIVTNFIQYISLQLVDQLLQTKLYWKAPNESYLHIYGMYKSDNRLLRYWTISNYKSSQNELLTSCDTWT